MILLTGHVPGQLVRALAAAGRARRSRRSTRGFATEPNEGDALHALPARRASWRGPGPCRARPGLRHRIGGLEKEDVTGNISYQPENHDHMTRLRAERIARVEVPDLEVDDPDGDATLLVLGWGSSYGAIEGAARRLRREQGAEAWPPRTCATSTRCRGTSAGAALLRAGAGAGDEHGPARRSCCGRSSSSTARATRRSTACRSSRAT